MTASPTPTTNAGFAPLTRSFSSTLQYLFTLTKSPNLSYFCTSCPIPGVSLDAIKQPSPFVPIPWAGDQLTFDLLNIQFKVDEKLETWKEIFCWMIGLAPNKSYDQYTQLKNNITLGQKSGLFSNGTMLVLNSANNPILEITYHDCFPVKLTELVYSSTAQLEFLTCTATFAYTYYDLKTDF